MSSRLVSASGGSAVTFNRDSSEDLHVRIGIHAGEPVEDGNDLFGVLVQMAARICDQANADTIGVSWAVVDEWVQEQQIVARSGWQVRADVGLNVER